jgi:hypothetical protein
MARSSAPIHSCPSCLAPLVEIRLGAELVMRSCSRCDSRFWSHGEAVADLGQVLSVVADEDRGRRPARAAH